MSHALRAILAAACATIALDCAAQTSQFKPINVVRWEDPLQRAFSCEVPASWKAEGGTFQPSAVDLRKVLLLESPDGQIFIRFGDVSLPPFVTPLPGFPEGSSYSPGYGLVMTVKSYRTGLQFAKEYALASIAQIGQSVQIVSARDRRDISDKQNAMLPSSPVARMALSAGDILATFSRDGRPFVGYCYAATLSTSTPNFANWSVNDLILCVCPLERKGEASLVIEHAIATVQINPVWAAQHNQTVAKVSNIVSETSNYMMDTINGVYERRSRSQDQAAQGWSDVILGRERWTGSDGKTYIAPNKYDHFFKMPNGDIVGTQSADPPSRDATRLDWKKTPTFSE